MDKIININNISQLPGEFYNIIKSNKINLTIEFESNSNVFNNFIRLHQTQKNIYVQSNNKLNIDLVEYSIDLYIFFIDCVNKAYKIIKSEIESNNLDSKLFGSINTWIISICHNIMFNFPFTLNNIIYIPINYIKECSNTNNPINLIRTLIHEKIHIGQRFNEFDWDKFIEKSDKNWIKILKTNIIFDIIENNIKFNKNNLILDREEFITNPDTFYDNFKYIYILGEKIYYGHYVFDSQTNKIKINFFIVNINKKLLEKILDSSCKTLEQEHPYEIYAYKISSDLI